MSDSVFANSVLRGRWRRGLSHAQRGVQAWVVQATMHGVLAGIKLRHGAQAKREPHGRRFRGLLVGELQDVVELITCKVHAGTGLCAVDYREPGSRGAGQWGREAGRLSSLQRGNAAAEPGVATRTDALQSALLVQVYCLVATPVRHCWWRRRRRRWRQRLRRQWGRARRRRRWRRRRTGRGARRWAGRWRRRRRWRAWWRWRR